MELLIPKDNLILKKEKGVFRRFNCLYCKKESIQIRQRTRPKVFCNSYCRNKALSENNKVNKICVICKKDYSVDFKSAKKSVSCSKKCYEKYRGGLKIADCMYCGKDVLGRQTSNRRKDFIFCSKSCHGRFKIRLKEPKSYSRKVYWNKIKNKEKICCDLCNITDIHILTIHHIDENRKNNSLDNLQLLCYNCHYKIHHEQSSTLTNYINYVKEVFNY